MKSSVTVIAMLTLAAFAALAVPAHAVHTGVTFTEVVSDDEGDGAADIGGFYDILSVSFGVTEDGDIVIATETAGTDAQASHSSIEVRFNANGGDYKVVFNPDGGHLSSSDDAFSGTDCEVVESTYYCLGIVDGDNIVLADGDTIESIGAFSKFITTDTGDSAETEDTYTYTTAPAGPTVEALEEIEPTIEASTDASSNETVVYTWDNTLGAIEVSYAFNITTGSVQVTTTTNGTELFDQTFEESTDGALPLESAPEGAYNITLTYTDFTGTVEIGIAAYVPESGGDGATDGNGTATDGDTDVDADDATDNTTATADNNSTASVEEEGLPMVGIFPVLAALAGLVVAVRRRR